MELLKESSDVDPASLDPRKGFIQITYMEPYFDDWELTDRVSVFDKSFNLRECFTLEAQSHLSVKFMYAYTHTTHTRPVCLQHSLHTDGQGPWGD